MEYSQQDVEDNMGLVHMVAHRVKDRLSTSGVLEYQDLVSEGVLGLIHALKNFDPDKGFRFSSYAVMSIQGYMFRGHRSFFRARWRAKENSGLDTCTISLSHPNAPNACYDVNDYGTNARGILKLIQRRMLWKSVLEVLTDRQREVISLVLEGLEPVQIARTLGCTRQAVKIVYDKAVERAKRAVATELHTCVREEAV